MVRQPWLGLGPPIKRRAIQSNSACSQSGQVMGQRKVVNDFIVKFEIVINDRNQQQELARKLMRFLQHVDSQIFSRDTNLSTRCFPLLQGVHQRLPKLQYWLQQNGLKGRSVEGLLDHHGTMTSFLLAGLLWPVHEFTIEGLFGSVSVVGWRLNPEYFSRSVLWSASVSHWCTKSFSSDMTSPGFVLKDSMSSTMLESTCAACSKQRSRWIRRMLTRRLRAVGSDPAPPRERFWTLASQTWHAVTLRSPSHRLWASARPNCHCASAGIFQLVIVEVLSPPRFCSGTIHDNFCLRGVRPTEPIGVRTRCAKERLFPFHGLVPDNMILDARCSGLWFSGWLANLATTWRHCPREHWKACCLEDLAGNGTCLQRMSELNCSRWGWTMTKDTSHIWSLRMSL